MKIHILAWSVVAMLNQWNSERQARAEDNLTPSFPTVSDYVLRDFLSTAGEKLSLHFTIEFGVPKPATIFGLGDESFSHDAPKEFPDVEELMRFISQSKELAAFAFLKSEHHPQVIHVVDRRLIKLNRYAMDRKVDLKFAGRLSHDLIDALRNDIDNMNHEVSPGDWRLHVTDDFTYVVIESSNLTVRQTCTSAIPLKCYGPLLWTSETNLKSDPPASGIQFFGLKEYDGYRQPWFDWVNRYTKQYDCLFTIETIYRSPEDPAVCPPFFGIEETFESVDALVAALTERVPTLTAVRNARNPKIIHLIDRELLALDDYPLVQPVDVDFQGQADGLVSNISQRLPAIDPSITWLGDERIQVEVRAEQQPVRDVLTDSVSSQRKSGVLWFGHTWLRDGQPPLARVYFPAPPQQAEQQPEAADPEDSSSSDAQNGRGCK